MTEVYDINSEKKKTKKVTSMSAKMNLDVFSVNSLSLEMVLIKAEIYKQ